MGMIRGCFVLGQFLAGYRTACSRILPQKLSHSLCRCLSNSQFSDSQSSLISLLDSALSSHGRESGGEAVFEVVSKLQRVLVVGPQSSRWSHDSDDLVPENLVNDLSKCYHSLAGNNTKKQKLFSFLARHLGVDHTQVASNAQQLLDMGKEEGTLLKSEDKLRRSLRPLYVDLFSTLAAQEHGLKLLVDMREDLMSILQGLSSTDKEGLRDSLQGLSAHLRELLAHWFSLGFMEVQRITWLSPCDIVEKVSQYEMVHRPRHWKDMKHRVGPYRRVFVYTHRSMPLDPVIILHCALSDGPSSNIQALLRRVDSEGVEDPHKITTAVFYSVSAVYKGLSGIDLGNSLIKRVLQELMKELPQIKQFVTLSPVPGFKHWLDTHLSQHTPSPGDNCRINEDEMKGLWQLYPQTDSHTTALQLALQDTKWAAEPDGELATALRKPLLSLCARYLVNEKRRGFALNPVAHFHLKNGASLWRLNWLGNMSQAGLQQSYGIMVNYHYHLPDISSNSSQYVMNGRITYSDSIAELL